MNAPPRTADRTGELDADLARAARTRSTTPDPSVTPRTANAIRTELLTGVDPKAPDEKLLVELAAGAAAITFQINVAADRLATVLPATLDEPRKAAVVAKVLHDIAVLGNTLVRRVESTLSTAATLRPQRRVHRGRDDL